MSARMRTGVILLVALALTMIAAVGEATPIRGVPIRERLELDFAGIEAPAPEGRCSAPAALLHYSGEGWMSHLGRVSVTSNHCSYVDEQGNPTGTYGQAELVIVAAGGDELHGTYRGWLVEGTTYAEILVITGGTGRFEDAVGVIVERVELDPETYAVSIRGRGRISY